MQIEQALNARRKFRAVQGAHDEARDNREGAENVEALRERPTRSRQEPVENFVGIERGDLAVKDVVAVAQFLVFDGRELFADRRRVEQPLVFERFQESFDRRQRHRAAEPPGNRRGQCRGVDRIAQQLENYRLRFGEAEVARRYRILDHDERLALMLLRRELQARPEVIKLRRVLLHQYLFTAAHSSMLALRVTTRTQQDPATASIAGPLYPYAVFSTFSA